MPRSHRMAMLGVMSAYAVGLVVGTLGPRGFWLFLLTVAGLLVAWWLAAGERPE